ncbi:MAG: hypothetical protein LBK41_06785 [Clostridiales bacterium]|nr:hypothetical protein [Clostridiales bacterium]
MKMLMVQILGALWRLAAIGAATWAFMIVWGFLLMALGFAGAFNWLIDILSGNAVVAYLFLLWCVSAILFALWLSWILNGRNVKSALKFWGISAVVCAVGYCAFWAIVSVFVRGGATFN